MIIDCISDLHGAFPELQGGDLLIVAGDLTARDTTEEALDFIYWLAEQDYKEKIVIAGNHDTFLINEEAWFINELEKISKSRYLFDSGTEFEGLKIWGSPWTKTFPNMNPQCKAFTVDTEEELAIKFSLIPDDTDILITHSPAYNVFDMIESGKGVGSKSLLSIILKIKPKIHVCGHIHENGGQFMECTNTTFVNSSHVNERYQPVNKPVRIEL